MCNGLRVISPKQRIAGMIVEQLAKITHTQSLYVLLQDSCPHLGLFGTGQKECPPPDTGSLKARGNPPNVKTRAQRAPSLVGKHRRRWRYSPVRFAVRRTGLCMRCDESLGRRRVRAGATSFDLPPLRGQQGL